jgi:Peptidase inhibitor I78 family
MRKIALIAPALLCACSTAPAAPIIHGETPGHTCQTTGTDRFIGHAGTGETGAAVKRASHAAVVRWAPPGYMLTMDYRADRVTVYLGPDSKITQIKCG